uniref:Solute carrier organic anion transporter family member n=1 Tax=Ciona savignyi TaxID=51511 RepID=H2Y4Q4_CIOSA
RISFLQRFATPKGALLFLCLASIAQSFIVSGLFGVIVSTIEKRFHLHSTETGLIASSYDVASCLLVLLITYIGGRGHKPLWIGWGVLVIGIGSIVFSLPHFFAPTYLYGEEIHNVCNSTIEQGKCSESSNIPLRYLYFMFKCESYYPRGFFVVGQLLHGAGGTTLFTLGVTYLDENVKQIQSSLYHGGLYVCAVLGPAMGFILGGQFLTIYTNLSESVNISESSSLWVGAWWLGFMGGGVVVVLLSVPILMLPKQLPGTSHVRVGRENEVHGGQRGFPGVRNTWTDVWTSGMVLLRNPTFILVTLAGTMDSALVMGIATFGPKYLESMFAFTPTQASTYFGVLTILAGVTGQLLGGVVVSKARLNVPGILKFCSVCSLIAALSSLMYFHHCPDVKFAGATIPYSGDIIIPSIDHKATCNTQCQCNVDLYDPVCGADGVTYYSPCVAGCTNVFENKVMWFDGSIHLLRTPWSQVQTSCVSEHAGIFGNPSESRDIHDRDINSHQVANMGVCGTKSCATQNLFFAMFFISILGTFSAGTPAIQVIMRVVPFTQRSFAIGVKFVILRILGSIPGPILFGRVLDLACVVWSTECGKHGFCQLYKNASLSANMAVLIVVLKFLVTSLFISSWWMYK